MAIERGEHFGKVNGAVDDLAAEPVGGADHLPGPEAAAGEEPAADLRPVVAPGVLVDQRRASELPPGDDGHILVEAAGMEILDERREPLVELRQVGVAHAVEVVGVEVPAAEVERHDPGTGLDEPAGDEEVLEIPRGTVAEPVGIPLAVALADTLGLIGNVECLGEPGAGENVEGAPGERVHAIEGARGVDVAPQPIDVSQQAAPVGEAGLGEVFENDVGARSAVGAKGGVRHPEEAGQPRRAVRRVAGVGREADEGRHRWFDTAEEFARHRPHARPAAGGLIADGAAGVTDEGVVVAVGGAVDAPQRDALVHDPGEPRHVLADLDARDVGRDRLELPADLRWGVHLQVVHVLVAGGPAHVDHDHRLVRPAAGGLLGGEDPWQREAADGERADAEHVAPGEAVAEPGAPATLLVNDREHRVFLQLCLGRAARLRPFLPVCSGLGPIPATTPQLYRTNLVGTNGTRTLVFARYLAAS